MARQPQPGCPLCRGNDVAYFTHAAKVDFYRCRLCRLTFKHFSAWPGPERERARYEQHNNDIGDPRYVTFLGRLFSPMCDRLEAASLERRQPGDGSSKLIGARGLDYGCGPTQVMTELFGARGHEVHAYDPFFAPDEGALQTIYDFVVCSEVFEHMHHPDADLSIIDSLLSPGGLLGVMTSLVDDSRDFSTWAYARDPTHVCFYHPMTMSWIAVDRGWSVEQPSENVTIFEKPVCAAKASIG